MDGKELAIKQWTEVRDLAQTYIDTYKQLAEAEQPKLELENGDYGVDKYMKPGGCWVHVAGNTYYPSGRISGMPKNSSRLLEERFGNIFVDLKALTVPLEEFEVKDWGNTLKVEIEDGYIVFGIKETYTYATMNHIEKAEEIHLNLGRLLYTQKMKGEK